MMKPSEFYALVGSVFGFSEDYFNYTKSHHGTDFPRGEGTTIPAWVELEITYVGSNNALGNYVVGRILTGEYAGKFAGFCHLRDRSPLSVGNRVSYGAAVGVVGATGDVMGAHLHATCTEGYYPGTGPWFDPLPIIRASIAAHESTTAGSGGQLILEKRAIDMDLYQYGPIDTRVWDGNVLTSPHMDITNAWEARYGSSTKRGGDEAVWAIWADRDGEGYDIPHGVIATCIRAQIKGERLAWNRDRGYYVPGTPYAAPTSSGVAGDLSPVLSAIAALDKQADGYQGKVEAIINKIPDQTADEIAARLTGTPKGA